MFKETPEGQTNYSVVDKFIAETKEEFNKQFISTTYPFLGGQRDFWKVIPDEKRNKEMKLINDIIDFITTHLTQLTEMLEEEKHYKSVEEIPQMKITMSKLNV